MFSWAIFFEYPSVHTEKLHDLKLKNVNFCIKNNWKLKIKNLLPVEFQNSMLVHRTADQVAVGYYCASAWWKL